MNKIKTGTGELWEQLKKDTKETADRLNLYLKDNVYSEKLTNLGELPFKEVNNIDCLCKTCAVEYIEKHSPSVIIIVPIKYCQSAHNE